jgi:hypothetical protein
MSDERATKRSGLLNIRAVTSKIFSPDTLANKIENLKETERNTLRSIPGPAPFIPDYGQPAQPTFAQTRGIFHGRLRNGQKEVLLLMVYQNNTRELLEFNGWSRSWSTVVSYQPGEPLSNYPEFPTQFEQCNNGIVVISQHDALPRFYDEDGHCAPLGYTKIPGAPSINGPQTSDTYVFADGNDSRTYTPNLNGFSVDANIFSQWLFPTTATLFTQMHTFFGRGRVGTTYSDAAVSGAPNDITATSLQNASAPGLLLAGAYSGAVQWVDKYGNFSAISPRSNVVAWKSHSAVNAANVVTAPTAGIGYPDNIAQQAANLLKQLMWHNISIAEEEPSDQKTVGRNLYRTRDIVNSETANDLYLLPSNADGGVFTSATLPGNSSELYTDNGPDGWLVAKAMDYVPMQRYRLCKQAFGRMFFANSPEDTGLLRYSLPGRWGTFLRDDFFYPDPSGGEITGLFPIAQGLLVFTESSTFLITDMSQETGFAVNTVSRQYGCVAPSSIAMTEDGTVIWLGKNAFYAYQNNNIVYFSDAIREELKYINTSRERAAVACVDVKTGEYRCWLPRFSSKTNDTCFVYDTRAPNVGWRTRTDVKASAVCVTQDHRNYMLAAGSTGTEPLATPESVYVLDTEVASTVYDAPQKTYTIETNWLLNESEYDAKTPITVYIWMLETASQTLDVEVFRDWRKKEIHTETVSLFYEKDPPPFFGEATLDTGETIRESRPYWSKAKVFVPGCEVFKIILKSTEQIEFVGLSYDYVPHPSGGARVQQ